MKSMGSGGVANAHFAFAFYDNDNNDNNNPIRITSGNGKSRGMPWQEYLSTWNRFDCHIVIICILSTSDYTLALGRYAGTDTGEHMSSAAG